VARRTFDAWATLIASLLAGVPAHAVCGQAPPIHVWPHRGVPVPTNARVFVTAPITWRGDATFTLQTAPRKSQRVARIGLKEQSWRGGGTERFELTPLAPLAPSTAYELRSSRDEVVGIFTTSVLEDKRPPMWSGVTRGHLWREKKGVIPVECGVPLVHLEGASEAVDDQTTSDDIRYALWAGKPDAPLDYAAPPLTWTARAREAKRFELNVGSSIPGDNDFELPKERPLRVGIKAYDLAANASDPSEVTLE
jgi:hypothetical protein